MWLRLLIIVVLIHIQKRDNRNDKDVHYEDYYAKYVNYRGAHINVFKNFPQNF